MWSKHYVGLDLTGFEDAGEDKAISRVTLFVDDEQAYTAGDDTGRELSGFCPSATQTMADNLLAQLKGYKYHAYFADAANIDPAAELGDGVTAGGVYSVVAQITDDGSGYFGLAAPGEQELDDEYPFEGPVQQEIKRKAVEMYSLIAKNNERITLEVGKITSELENYATIEMTDASIELAVSESKIYTDGKIETLGTTVTTDINGVKTQIKGLDGEITTISETLDGLTVTDSNGTTKISGSSIETDTLYVKSANITGELTAQKLSGDKVNIVSSTGTIYGEMSVSSSGALYILSGVASGFLLGGTDAKPTVACLGTFYAENYEERIYTLERLMGLA